ncbi:MAG: metallophosphoesterase family protein [Thermofilum sp.]
MFTLEVSEKHESCVLCSDLHCEEESECWQLQAVLNFAANEKVDCLLILGDLFDRLHYRLPAEELKKHFEKLTGEAELPRYVYYTTSLSSHDPILPAPAKLKLKSSELLAVPGVLRLRVGGHSVCGLHGDLVVSSGVLAFLLNKLASAASRELLLEEIAKRRFCSNREWVFAGHTHLPGLDPVRRLGNPGSWKATWSGKIPYWKPSSFSVIKVSANEVKLLRVRL